MEYNVSQDGQGAFRTVGEALSSIKNDAAPVLHLHAGTYREKLVLDIPHLTLRGDGTENTRIVYGDSAHLKDASGEPLGTFRTATLRVHAPHVTLEGLTVENDAGPGEQVEQAVALYIAGDCCFVRDCVLTAHQDTLLIGPDKGPVNEVTPCGRRAALEKCVIKGNVDFIFGSYAAWFEECTLTCVSRHAQVNAMLSAPNTPQGQEFGFVFHNCRVNGNCEAGSVYLGRPWRPYGRASFMHCHFPACVAPQGWLDWASPFRPVWPGLEETADTYIAHRHPGAGVITPEMEKRYTPQNVLAGTEPWNPFEKP